ncbi:nitroreductase family protein [Bacillus sonorensis]|nr:nitroreductase family protein [Bacillus sonorensis]
MSDTLQAKKGSVRETIRNRRTIRKFTHDPVPKELVLELLEDAVYAPNHLTDRAVAVYLYRY